MKARIQHGLAWATLVAVGVIHSPLAWAQRERGAAAQPTAPRSGQVEDPFSGPNDGAAAESIDPLDKKIEYRSKQSTVGGFVAAINESMPGLNIVVTPEATMISLPQMDLSQVKVRSALRLLSRIHPQLRIDEDDDGTVGGDSRVILISWQGPPENSAYRVISVKHLLGTYDQEKLLEALDDGYSFIQHGGGKPELRLHQATGLLFVKGSEPQVMFAAQIVAELSRMPVEAGMVHPGVGSMGSGMMMGAPAGYGYPGVGAAAYGGVGSGPGGGYMGGMGEAGPGYGPPPGYGAGSGGAPAGYGGSRPAFGGAGGSSSSSRGAGFGGAGSAPGGASSEGGGLIPGGGGSASSDRD